MNIISKNKVTYDEIKPIFNDEIIKSVNIIASEKPNNNRTKLLKIFFDLREFFTRTVDDL